MGWWGYGRLGWRSLIYADELVAAEQSRAEGRAGIPSGACATCQQWGAGQALRTRTFLVVEGAGPSARPEALAARRTRRTRSVDTAGAAFSRGPSSASSSFPSVFPGRNDRRSRTGGRPAFWAFDGGSGPASTVRGPHPERARWSGGSGHREPGKTKRRRGPWHDALPGKQSVVAAWL